MTLNYLIDKYEKEAKKWNKRFVFCLLEKCDGRNWCQRENKAEFKKQIIDCGIDLDKVIKSYNVIMLSKEGEVRINVFEW